MIDPAVLRPNCELCGEPMPAGEEMFKHHGYSGPCPLPRRAKPLRHYRMPTPDKRMERHWMQCKWCNGYAEAPNGEPITPKHQLDCPVAELEALEAQTHALRAALVQELEKKIGLPIEWSKASQIEECRIRNKAFQEVIETIGGLR